MKLGCIRYLKTDSEYQEYIERASELIGVEFPEDYLKRNRTIGYFDSKGRLIGGCAFIINGPYRVIESLPEEGLERVKALVPMQEDMFELTGLWLDKKTVTGPGCAWFWARMYIESVLIGRPYILYAYSASKPKLGNAYKVAQPTEIFRGETKVLKGMPGVDIEVVEIAAMRNVHKAWLTQPQFLIKRIFKKSQSRRLVSAQGELS